MLLQRFSGPSLDSVLVGSYLIGKGVGSSESANWETDQGVRPEKANVPRREFLAFRRIC